MPFQLPIHVWNENCWMTFGFSFIHNSLLSEISLLANTEEIWIMENYCEQKYFSALLHSRLSLLLNQNCIQDNWEIPTMYLKSKLMHNSVSDAKIAPKNHGQEMLKVAISEHRHHVLKFLQNLNIKSNFRAQ